MASKVISFRFGNAELEALQALQVPEDESVNQTAARLLRGLVGTSTPVSTTVDIKELVRQEVSAAIADFRREIDERLGQYSAQENAASVEESPVSLSTTVDNELLQQLQEELDQLRSRNLELETEKQQLQETIGNSLTPDYLLIRDRVLGKLKVGKQSAGGKAIEAFIKELKSQPLTPNSQLPTSNPPTVSSSAELFDGEQQPKAPPTTAASLVKEAYKRYEQSNFRHTNVYENELSTIAAKCGLRLFQDIKGKYFYVTPMDNRSQKLITTSSIGGVAEFLSSQPLLDPPLDEIKPK